MHEDCEGCGASTPRHNLRYSESDRLLCSDCYYREIDEIEKEDAASVNDLDRACYELYPRV
jgi:hypothetical protein